jgi:hypothetical protein
MIWLYVLGLFLILGPVLGLVGASIYRPKPHHNPYRYRD